jgi:malate/lactate dehydrogenase
MHPEQDAFLECKAVVGPEGVEHVLELALESEQRRRHEEYRKRVVELTRKLA